VEDVDSIFPISVLIRNRIGRLSLEIIEGKILHDSASIELALLHDSTGMKVARWAGWATCGGSCRWAKVLRVLRKRLTGPSEQRSKSGRGSWLAGRAVENPRAAIWAMHRRGIRRQAGPGRRFRPTDARKYEKGFLFFKSFLNFKPI
jgi:hypothetical protein